VGDFFNRPIQEDSYLTIEMLITLADPDGLPIVEKKTDTVDLQVADKV